MDLLMRAFVVLVAPGILTLGVIYQFNDLSERIDHQRDRITRLDEEFMDFKVKAGYCVKQVLKDGVTVYECKG